MDAPENTWKSREKVVSTKWVDIDGEPHVETRLSSGRVLRESKADLASKLGKR